MRRFLFFIISGVVVFLLIIIFLVFQIFQAGRQPSNTSPEVVIPTPVRSVSSEGGTVPKPPIKYDDTKTSELIQKAKTRQPLSASGASAKAQLIASLGGKSGTLFSNNNTIIEYVVSPDLFQAQIKTLNISIAKQEAVNWMISQGFTKTDVCTLPFSFYLSPSIMLQLKNTNSVFNPLPEGC